MAPDVWRGRVATYMQKRESLVNSEGGRRVHPTLGVAGPDLLSLPMFPGVSKIRGGSMNHPRTIEEISAPWLTDVLRGAGILRRTTVRAVDVCAIGEGLGFLSGRARVTISYDQIEEGAPATVVVKLPVSIKAGSDVAESLHAYEREIRFYREVAPRTPIRVPRVFAMIMEPADGIFIIVMEDLTGLTVGDQVKGMSRAQVLAAARTIAPLHARWWNGDQRQLLPWVPSVEQRSEERRVGKECRCGGSTIH